LILITLEAVLAFELTVIVFSNAPTLSVAYFTLISELAPGLIGSLGQVGTVQPHEPTQFFIISGSLPVFLNLNTLLPSALFFLFDI